MKLASSNVSIHRVDTFWGQRVDNAAAEKRKAPPETGGSDPLVLTSIEGGHYQNFVDAVRANDRSILTAEIEDQHLSTTLPLIANVAYRVGRELAFDGKTEQFVGDDEANARLVSTTRPNADLIVRMS